MDVTEYSIVDLAIINQLNKKKNSIIKRELPNQKEFLFKYVSIQFPNFFFEVMNTGRTTSQGEVTYQVKIKPYSDTSADTGQTGRNTKGVITLFDAWVARIDKYAELYEATNNIQESILEQAEEEILDWFEIIDEDADKKAYDTKTQFLIDRIAQNVIDAVNEYKGAITEDDKVILIQEATELKENQTTYTKKETVRRISKLWARTKKVSITLFKEALKDLIKDGIKGLLKGDYNETITYLLS